MKELNIITSLHTKTKRNYIERMIDKKVECMTVSKKYGYDYWDGNRKFGYGGYKYIPGRWEQVAKKFIQRYKLNIIFFCKDRIFDFIVCEIIQIKALSYFYELFANRT